MAATAHEEVISRRWYKAKLRILQERAYRFMSAIAGNFPDFEEASRALFANNMLRFKELIADWPKDVRDDLVRLCTDDQPITHTNSK